MAWMLIGKLASTIDTVASKPIALISVINQTERLHSISEITM